MVIASDDGINVRWLQVFASKHNWICELRAAITAEIGRILLLAIVGRPRLCERERRDRVCRRRPNGDGRFHRGNWRRQLVMATMPTKPSFDPTV